MQHIIFLNVFQEQQRWLGGFAFFIALLFDRTADKWQEMEGERYRIHKSRWLWLLFWVGTWGMRSQGHRATGPQEHRAKLACPLLASPRFTDWILKEINDSFWSGAWILFAHLKKILSNLCCCQVAEGLILYFGCIVKTFVFDIKRLIWDKEISMSACIYRYLHRDLLHNLEDSIICKHHFGKGSSLSHQAIKLCPTTYKLCLCTFWQIPI